ncbi:MAG: hypothetical protein DFNUSKGM_002978 [Candidatus Fervidibacter sacchari]
MGFPQGRLWATLLLSFSVAKKSLWLEEDLEPQREGTRMGETKRALDVPMLWRVLGVIGLVAAIVLWLYAYFTPGRQDSAVSVGSAFFSSGVILLMGTHLLSVLQQK